MSPNSPSLKRRIFEDIALNGPMPLSRYMNICLGDPEYGYYTNRDPFGAAGDFVTAPEISQMFGELIGIWLISAWENLGSPAQIRLVEMGPGRGTLMADCLRSLALKPQLTKSLQIEMVEMSPILIAEQQQRLSNAPCPVCWSSTLEASEIPSLIIANEFYDALPVHVLVKTSSGIFERHVVGSGSDSLAFADLPASLPNSALLEYENLPENTVFELSPERHQITQKISSVVKQHGGGALLIDYGFEQPNNGTTFQALKNHKPVDPLDEPGHADLTSLVDFTAVQKEFLAQGLNVHGPTSQMDFLLNLGLLERAGHLGASANLQTQTALQNAVKRLVSPDEMGTLFKVISAMTIQSALPGFSKDT